MAKFKPSNEQSMGEALDRWLDQYRLRHGFNEASVLLAWDAVLGPSIARQTIRKKMQNGTLIVELESAVVRKELLSVKSKIIAALNEHLGREAVRELHLF
ncbi:MAG: hypothetical protein RL754_1232 [Bacteroidota bacterium]|jgi:predicted nucleic acid-binding Zn ribbon protein